MRGARRVPGAREARGELRGRVTFAGQPRSGLVPHEVAQLVGLVDARHSLVRGERRVVAEDLVELLDGAAQLVGLGGVWIEALKDVRLMPADLAVDDIVAELRALKAAPLLELPRERVLFAIGDVVIKEAGISPRCRRGAAVLAVEVGVHRGQCVQLRDAHAIRRDRRHAS